MTTTFKINDRIRCVNASDTIGDIVNNKVYTVSNVDGLWGEIFVIDENGKETGSWKTSRFVLASKPLEEQIEEAKKLIGKQIYHGRLSGTVRSWVVRQQGESSGTGNKYMRDNNLEYCVCVRYDSFEIPYVLATDTPPYKELKLNDSYTATVHKDRIEVGCQTFTIEQVRNIIKLNEEL